MPMIWDATAEAKLMSAIFTVCDVKVSQPQLKQLADIMGSDCTPKAITHRLAKLRKGAAGSTEAEAKDEEPKTKKARTMPVSGKKGGRQPAKKRATTPIDSDAEENADRLTPPASERPQRNGGAKRTYEETKIKEEELAFPNESGDGISVGEDIGQGEFL